MISPSAAFATANAKLAKQPIFVIDIEGYTRAFATQAGLGSFSGLVSNFVLQLANLGNGGGLMGFPGTVTLPNATPAGNILFAFLNNNDSGFSPAISDTAGNTWHALYANVAQLGGNGEISIWYAIALGTGPGNQVTFTTGGNRSSSDFYVLEVGSQYSGFVNTHTSGTSATAAATTSDGDVMSVPLTSGVHTWDLFEISLRPASGTAPGIPLGFLCTGFSTVTPVDLTQIISRVETFTFILGAALATGYDWLVSIDDQKLTVSDLDGGSNLSDLVFTVQDRDQQLTADLASVVFEGKQARLRMGFQGMAIADYLTMFTGQIDTVDSANGNLDYVFTVSDQNIKKLSQKIYTVGDDGFAISSSHPKTLLDNPLNILVDALEQAGILAAKIDTAKMNFYRDTIFNGILFDFKLTSAPTAKDFIENELMKPLGMYIWQNNLGLVSVNSFYPAVSGNGTYTPPTPPVMTAKVSTTPADVNQLDAPLAQEAPLINQVIFRFDDDGGGNSGFLAEEIVDLDSSMVKYGQVGGQTIESQGMRSGFQGYFMAALVGRLISLRYGFKNLILDPLPLTWNACVLEPGDIIAVNNPFMPDRVAGVLGISNMFFEVLDRNWRFMDGVIEVKLLAIDYSLFKQYLITPNAEADYAAASTLDKGKYMFQCGADGKYSTGAAANTLG